jgi:hypothetical protein
VLWEANKFDRADKRDREREALKSRDSNFGARREELRKSGGQKCIRVIIHLSLTPGIHFARK